MRRVPVSIETPIELVDSEEVHVLLFESAPNTEHEPRED